MKKSIKLILLLMMLLGFSACFLDLKDEHIKNGFVYYNEDGEVMILGYEGSSSELVIPSSIDGAEVTLIREKAFAQNSFRSVVIPDTVKTIEAKAFYNSGIETLTIGNSVESIGDYAFRYNKLTAVVIPDSVTSMGLGVFFGYFDTNIATDEEIDINTENTNAILTVSIGSGLTEIPSSTFYGNKIENLVIPDNIVKIGGGAFYGNSISSLDLGSVEEIGEIAFSTNSLSVVNTPDTLLTIGVGAFNENESIELHCKEGSAAHIYAEENNINFVFN